MSSLTKHVMTIEVIDVSKRYGDVYALKSVSLKMQKGECMALLGSNGAGKTTLLKIIATHTVPTAGVIKILGEDIFNNDGSIRRKIGLVTHDSYLYDELTIKENLQFYGQFFVGNGEAIPLDRIEFLGLMRWYNVPVKQLSYGLRKRADIGRALLHSPDVILFDEPFAGLDVNTCDLLVQYFKEQKENGKTLMLSSHSSEWIKKVCDREVVLKKGKIVDENHVGEKDQNEF
jgi:ABC-type multidrug transport system ATPase subunit